MGKDKEKKKGGSSLTSQFELSDIELNTDVTEKRGKRKEQADISAPPVSKRERTVVSAVLEKALVNLGVIADIEIGDKIDRTPSGNLIIQKPGWYTTALRMVKGVSRAHTLDLISDLIGGTENSIRDGYNDPRIKKALINAVHGLCNLQATYEEDALFKSSIQVLLQRIEIRYGLKDTQMI